MSAKNNKACQFRILFHTFGIVSEIFSAQESLQNFVRAGSPGPVISYICGLSVHLVYIYCLMHRSVTCTFDFQFAFGIEPSDIEPSDITSSPCLTAHAT